MSNDNRHDCAAWAIAGVVLGHLLCIGAQYMAVPGTLLKLVRGIVQ